MSIAKRLHEARMRMPTSPGEWLPGPTGPAEPKPMQAKTWTHHNLLPETLDVLHQILAMDWENGSQADAIEAGRRHNAAVMARASAIEAAQVARPKPVKDDAGRLAWAGQS